MNILRRRAFQGAVLAIPALVCFVEVQRFWAPAFDSPLVSVLDDLLPGSAFMLAGLIEWYNRPKNRVGGLMICVGIGLLIGTSPSVAQLTPLAETLVLVLGISWLLILLVL